MTSATRKRPVDAAEGVDVTEGVVVLLVRIIGTVAVVLALVLWLVG